MRGSVSFGDLRVLFNVSCLTHFFFYCAQLNAGFDATDILNKLRAKHAKDPKVCFLRLLFK